MLEFLIGNEVDGDTVKSCTGGLLGAEILGKNIFTVRLPVLGLSACDLAGFLQVVVNLVDDLLNDCPANDAETDECDGTLQVLQERLESLLQGKT